MKNYREINGDLFKEIFTEKYDVTLQGNNCFNTQGAGIVIPFKKHFQTDTFPMELSGKGDINKLGQIDCRDFYIKDGEVFRFGSSPYHKITVCNCYSQYHYGLNHKDGVSAPIDYEALVLCLRKINHTFAGKRVVLPFIGAGLAQGNPERIRKIIQTELSDCDTTLVIYKP